MSRRPVPRERDTVGPALAWLKLAGARVHRRNVGSFKQEYKGKTHYVQFNETGMCDYWFILPDGSGRHVEMEWKRPGGWPRPEQILWMLAINSEGGIAFWARDLKTVQTVVTALLRGERLYQYTSGQYEFRRGSIDECKNHNLRSYSEFIATMSRNGRISPKLKRYLKSLIR
jgi:hypothetical protein